MKSTRLVSVSSLVLALLAAAPAALAQTTTLSSMAGVVKDTTGSVLPGVVVEASSPVLIERVHTTVTDSSGQYKMVDLRPGTYAVTFTLTGFNVVRREGIELTSTFTAAVNAEMRVGAVEETVTVTGASPVVDLQNVAQSRVVNKAMVDSLPTSRMFQTIAAVIPAVSIGGGVGAASNDVGGSAGEKSQALVVHGSRLNDMQQQIDGIGNNSSNSASTSNIFIDSGSIEEFAYGVAANTAETEGGGVLVNMIPREGGNQFKSTIFGTFTNHSLQSDNISQSLRDRGLPTVNRVNTIFDVNPGFGGPIRRNKLWFYFSARYWGQSDRVAGSWYQINPGAHTYVPDLTRPALDDSLLRSATVRPTWQVTPRNKIVAYMTTLKRDLYHEGVSALVAPEAAIHNTFYNDHKEIVSWTSTFSSHLLLEVATSRNSTENTRSPQDDLPPGSMRTVDQGTGRIIGGPSDSYYREQGPMYDSRVALTFLTGAHAFKLGFTHQRTQRFTISKLGDLYLNVLNGVPRSIQINATPYSELTKLDANLGVYTQDQWTIRRLTLNLGVRFDDLHASVPAQTEDATRLLPPRSFDAVPDVPNWKDVSPRLGAAWDVFGTGRTALKASLSRYSVRELITFANNNNPVITSINSTTRTWTDTNGNFYPDCDLVVPTTNGECGPLANVNFGKNVVTTRYDDSIRKGFGVRPYNWETSAGVQHELLPGVSVNAAYFRRWYGNFTATQNLAVSASDFDPYCVTAPTDARLPGSAGQICGLFDIKPAKVGQVNSLITNASGFGKQWEHYNGVDFTTNARLARGVTLGGGVNVGRSETNNCDVVVGNPHIANPSPSSASVTLPRTAEYCDVKPPFVPQVKFMGTYPLPWWGVQVASTFQSLPGPIVQATQTVTNAQILPSLGRNLASGANGTVAVDLIPVGIKFGERINQVDFRLSKIVRFGRARLMGNLDVYNLFNRNPVLTQNNTYGAAWAQPTYVLPGRLFKFGGQLDF